MNSSRPVPVLAGVLLIALAPFVARAQPARPVFDINQGTAPPALTVREVATTAFGVLFAGCTPESGCEPWISDGTSTGTKMLADLMPGPTSSSPTGFARVGNVALFWAFAGGGDRELWRTDGTAEGTTRVHPPPDRLFGSQPLRFVEAGGITYFTSRTGDGRAIVWRTDGTAEGTNFVANGVDGAFMPEGGLFLGVRNTLFFEALGGIWKTDGTRDRTIPVIPNPGNVASMVDFGGRLAFLCDVSSRRSLWLSDGTTTGSMIVKSWDKGSFGVQMDDLLPLGGFLYFTACEPATGCELWRTDGSPMGTALAADVQPGTSSGAPRNFAAAGESLLFLSESSGAGIFAFDPVSRFVQKLHSLNVGIPNYLAVASLDGAFLLHVRGYSPLGEPDGSALVLTNGTPSGTRLVVAADGKPVVPTSNFATRARDVLVGARVAGLPGLSSVDKATAVLRPLNDQAEVTPGSDPATFTALDGVFYFGADEAANSRWLWRTDGTAPGTARAADVALPNLSPTLRGRMAALEGRLYFKGCDAEHGCELWGTDGSSAGTRLVRDLLPGPLSGDPEIVATVRATLFFATWSADGLNHVLWKSDGSTDGTRILIGDVFPVGDPYSSHRALALGGKLLLAAQTTATDCGLAAADPDNGTITMLRRFTTYASGGAYCPDQLASFAGRAFFVAAEVPTSSQPLLWTTDATPEGTRPFLDERGARIQTGSVAATPTHLFFTAYRSAAGNTQLWRTDGSAGGTTLVVTLPRFSPEYISNPPEMVTAGETLYFTWSDAEHGTELWKSDGTADGSGLVGDIRPGVLGSFPHSLTAAAGRLYFGASDGVHGVELWTSDGTEAGTVMVQDIAPGAASSNPADLTATCDSLFFSADDGEIGREPWVLRIPVEPGLYSPCHRAVTGPVTGTPVRRRGASAASRKEAAE